MEKEFNLTTAISYVNGPPHIGHVLEIVIADVISRYHQIKGDKVHFLTGTDEHGQKIQDTATKEGLSSKELCDQNSTLFKEIYEKIGITYNTFIRTTDSYHRDKVYDFYERCKQNGDIYLAEYEGWYNPREEKFVSLHEATVNDYKDPVTGDNLVHSKEPSYFFRLKKYQTVVKNFLEENQDFILPRSKGQDILNRLSNTELEDLSISRTSISWGIPIPDDSDHVFYVWFDALINYISGGPWPADLHVIGKDILWFHTTIWLSMLFSAKYPVPKCIYVHDFLNDLEGKKMSKSIGNVIDPNMLIEKYPVSAIRYYLISNLNYGMDMNFNEADLIRSHDSELLEVYGNFISRVFGLVHKYSQGKIMYYLVDGNSVFNLDEITETLEQLMAEIKLQEYINRVMGLVRVMNVYINDTHIWSIGKDNHPEDTRSIMDQYKVIGILLESLYIISHFIYPVIPDIAEKVFELLGTSRITIPELTWGNLQPQILSKQKATLFDIIDKDAYENRKMKNIK
jgi:methionyl-tRNA synthetase